MRLLPPIDAPKLKAMGKGTPLNFVPSEGLRPLAGHTHLALVGESKAQNGSAPSQAPWIWFSMQMAIGLGVGVVVFLRAV